MQPEAQHMTSKPPRLYQRISPQNFVSFRDALQEPCIPESLAQRLLPRCCQSDPANLSDRGSVPAPRPLTGQRCESPDYQSKRDGLRSPRPRDLRSPSAGRARELHFLQCSCEAGAAETHGPAGGARGETPGSCSPFRRRRRWRCCGLGAGLCLRARAAAVSEAAGRVRAPGQGGAAPSDRCPGPSVWPPYASGRQGNEQAWPARAPREASCERRGRRSAEQGPVDRRAGCRGAQEQPMEESYEEVVTEVVSRSGHVWISNSYPAGLSWKICPECSVLQCDD
ncbi:zinc finger protein 32 isoform X1 [Gorilla gorilla gorilla]|uniref:zinc finger protein 32 isoform X1 n=1 Tax=Gorilla gorilla gorilla TaxID=9595 RepID=UPI00300B3D7A